MLKEYSSDKPHPVDLHVGHRVSGCRLECGISRKSLAALIGKTYQQLQKYETASNRISASVLYDLSRALRVDPGYFYEGYTPDKPAPSQPDHPPAPASWSRLYHELQPADRRAISTMIHHLIRK